MNKHIISSVLALSFLSFFCIGCEPAGNGRPVSIDSDEVSERESRAIETVKLYFIQFTDGIESVVPVTREIHVEQCIMESALISLLNGVTDVEKNEGYSSSIPAGTELISFEMDTGIARCDFSRDIEPGGGSAWVMAIRDQITKTLRQFDEVDRVEIMVESRTEDVLQP